ncbi:MAG: hypothetical protein ACOY4Q_09900 [Bacillota bacterium]
MADGTVNASITTDRVSARVKAKVSCVGNQPTGTLDATVVVRRLLRRETLTVTSNRATLVKTVKRPSIEHVEAHFRDVTIRNLTTNEVLRNCTAVLVATQVASNLVLLVLSVNCPGNRNLRLFGFFRGDVDVFREDLCGDV